LTENGKLETRAWAEKTKGSELAFAAPWLVPSPRYFAKLSAITG
jgi:hypothetical protein